jgi:pimeloyl-ACP methyl ester carboxylesterase
MRTFLAFLLSLTIEIARPGLAHAAQVSRQVDSLGREYYLFTPDKLDPDVTYWLVVEVHGYGGHGSENSGARAWVDRGDCIGIAPSFPNEGYQMLGKDSDRQLTGIFQKLKGDFKLHDKLFIYGHSGGAQYSHRFTLKYPWLVAGCCATSAGSWSTGAPYGTLTGLTMNVPMAISCGERDSAFSTPGSPMTRIDWARKFVGELQDRHFFYKALYWPNAGHEGDAAGNAELAAEAFDLGTSGMVGKDRDDFDAKLKTLNDLVQSGEPGQAMISGGALLKQMKLRDDKQTAGNLAASQWSAGPAAIAACTQTAQGYASERLAKLSIDIQSAALNQVAGIEKQAAPDAVSRLQSLCGTFAGWPRVRTAATQAAQRLQARAR